MTRVIRGVGALLALAALLLGAPIALATWWGNPWPAGGWDEVQLLSTDTIVGALAVAGWILWALMAICILVETYAAVTGQAARRIPLTLPGQQELAQLLVASVAALGMGTSITMIGGSTAIHTATTTPATAAPTTTATATRRDATTAASGPTVTTETDTTAWRIAETRLDQGPRWKEILHLNHGIRFPDGTTFTDGTQTIPAGTTLRLPADASRLPAIAPQDPPRASSDHKTANRSQHDHPEPEQEAHTVTPGDTLWAISEKELNDPYRYMDLFEESKDTAQPGGERLTDPDLIKPGWIITIPNTPGKPNQDDQGANANQDSEPPEKAPPATASTGSPPQGRDPAGDTAADTDIEAGPRHHPSIPGTNRIDNDESTTTDQENVLTAPWILAGLTGGGALLAGALLLGLRRRRAAQFRARRPGRAIATPDPEHAPAEKTITAAGDTATELLAYLDTALRRLAGAAHEDRRAMPAVAAIEIDARPAKRLTLHLSEPSDLPAPWQATPDRLHWHVPTTLPGEQLGPLSDEADAPYPLLVTIGHADNGEPWLLNCEDLGTLTLTGDLDRARDLARHLVAQLAVNAWSQAATIDCIGIADQTQPLGESIRYHPTVTDGGRALAEALADAVAMVDRAAAHNTDTPTGRTGQADCEIWPSRVLVLDRTTEEPEHLDTLLDLIENHPRHTATSIILIGQRPKSSGIELRLTADGHVVLEEAGLTLTAVSLTSDEAQGVSLIYSQAQLLDDQPISVDETVRDGWEAYADRSGGLRRDHTTPRVRHDSAEPTTTLLDGDDQDYTAHAAVLTEDLETLSPTAPTTTRSQVEDADPTLDRDLADWFNDDSKRLKLSLLGPVFARTHGKALAKRRAYFTELLVFLWFHRNSGAARDQIAEAFGTPADRVRKDISVLRDWLGTNPHTGQSYLPFARRTPATQATGVNAYQLDDGLLVDWDLFQRLRIRGQARGGTQGRADLAQALDLVTGRPCEHQRPGGWTWLADDERHDFYMQHAVADIALILATHYLSEGDTKSARAVTETALEASPDDESTRLCLVQITHAEGDHAQAKRILFEEICNRSDDGEAPTDLNERTKAIVDDHDEWLAG